MSHSPSELTYAIPSRITFGVSANEPPALRT